MDVYNNELQLPYLLFWLIQSVIFFPHVSHLPPDTTQDLFPTHLQDPITLQETHRDQSIKNLPKSMNTVQLL